MNARRIRALLAALLWLAACPAALAQTLNGRDLFTLEIPKEWQDYGIDTGLDVEGQYYDLGFAGGPGARDLNVSLSLYAYPEYAGLRLFDADERQIQDFTAMIMQEYDGSKFMSVRRVSQYDIPFSVFLCKDGQAQYICAATLANGWAIVISGAAYADGKYDAMRALNGDDIAQFMEILDSFEPVLKGNER